MVNIQKRRALVQVVYREQPRTVGKILTPVWLCGKARGSQKLLLTCFCMLLLTMVNKASRVKERTGCEAGWSCVPLKKSSWAHRCYSGPRETRDQDGQVSALQKAASQKG